MISRCSSQPCIITFMGPVGVGKSTHIRLLKKYFKLRKIKVVSTFIKSSHGLTYFLNRCILAPTAGEKSSSAEGFPWSHKSREVLRKLFPLYRFLDGISIAAKFFFTVYLPYRMGFTVLIEEGLMMTLYTYDVVFPHFFDTQPTLPPLIIDLLRYLASQNPVYIVLDADARELEQRRRHRGYRQKELAEYIAMQKKWLGQLKSHNSTFINTTNERLGTVHKTLLLALKRNFSPKNGSNGSY